CDFSRMPFPPGGRSEDPMQLTGKKAVVVGGGSGMGRSTAEALAAGGAAVAILDREPATGKEVADAIGASFREVDVVDFDGAEQALADTVADLGGLHIIVTTAGGGIAQRTLTKTGPHALDAFLQVL